MLTYNSGATLRRALESVKDFDDILLNDGSSTDDTLRIAAEYGARVIMQDARLKYPNGRLADFGAARNQMMGEARYDWYLWLDSDESISKELRDEIAEVVGKPVAPGDPLAYRVPLRIIIDGRLIKHSSNYPGYQFRFFNRKSGGHLTQPLHNRVEFNQGTVIGVLKHYWHAYLREADISPFAQNAKAHRRVEIEFACKRSFLQFLRYTVWWELRAIAGIILRSLYNYARYGFKDSMPVKGEMSRVFSLLRLIGASSLERIRRAFGYSAFAD
jgi:glycosyltransferase involved in cell wall biosynthesis